MEASDNGQGLVGETFPVETPPWTPAQIAYVSIGAILALMAFAEVFAFTGAVSYAFIKVHQKAKRWGERYLSLSIMLLWWLLRAIFLFGMLSLVPVPHYKNDALLPDSLREASVYVAFSLVLILLILPTLISIQQLMTAPSNMKERLDSIRDTASFPRVLIVMPVYNELPEILHVAICSVIDGEYPKEHVHIFISFDNDAVSELYLALIASLGVPPSDHYPPVIDLYYRGVQITVSRFPHGGKRLTQKKTFALIGTIYQDYPEKTDHLFVLFIDSDILLHPATLGNFMWEMELKPSSRKDMLGMTGMITVTTKQNMSFIALLQDMEYVHGQFFGRAIESAVGGVICLPGALTMFRYSAFLKSSDEYFAERDAKDLWDFGRSHLGEDRYLTHLLMAGAKRPKMIQFCHRATCKTEPVMEWRNLLKQRRRWFLGFITNESSLLSDPLMWRKYPFLLAFRMLQNIVFGTSMIAYLIVVAVITGTQNLSWVWLSLLGVYFLTNWVLMLTYGIWLGRRKAWLYPIMFIVGPIVSWFLLVYGVWTANERTWGGPRADASKAAEEGENHQPIEEGAVVTEEQLKDDHDDHHPDGGHHGSGEKPWTRDVFFDDLTDDSMDIDTGHQADSESELPPLSLPPFHVISIEDEQDNEDAKTFRTAHEDMDADNLSPRVSTEIRPGVVGADESETNADVLGGRRSMEPTSFLALDLKQEPANFLSLDLKLDMSFQDDDDNRSEPKLGQPAARKRRDSTVSLESVSSSSSGHSVASTSSSKSTTCGSIRGGEALEGEECLVIHPLGLASTPRVHKDSQWWLDSEQLESLGIVPFTQRPKVPEAFASVETLILSPVHMTESNVSLPSPPSRPTRPKLEHRKSTSAAPMPSRRDSMHETLASATSPTAVARDRKPRASASVGNLKSRTLSFVPSATTMPMPTPRDFSAMISTSSRSSPSTPAQRPAYLTPSASGSIVSLDMLPAAIMVHESAGRSSTSTTGSSSNPEGNNGGTGSMTPRQRRMSIMPANPHSFLSSPPMSSPSPVFQYIPSAYITPTHSAPASPRLPPTAPPSLPSSPILFPATPPSFSLTNSPRHSPTPDGQPQDPSTVVPSTRRGRTRVATAPGGSTVLTPSMRARSRSQSRSRASTAVAATAVLMTVNHGTSGGGGSGGGGNSSSSDSADSTQRRIHKRLSKGQGQSSSSSSSSSSSPMSAGSSPLSASYSPATQGSSSTSITSYSQHRNGSSVSLGYHGQEDRHPPASSSSSSPSLGGASGHRRSTSSTSARRRASLDSTNIVTTEVSFTRDGIVPPVPPLPRVLVPVQAAVPNDILRAAVMVAAHHQHQTNSSSSSSSSGGGANPPRTSSDGASSRSGAAKPALSSSSSSSLLLPRPSMAPRTSSLVVQGKSKWLGPADEATSPVPTAAKITTASSSSSSSSSAIPRQK